MHRVAIHWVRLLFMLGLVAMAVVGWLAPWAVKILFERGAFTAQDTLAVSELLRYGVIQFPFYFAGLVLVSSLLSQKRHKLVAVGAAVNLLVKVGANFAFIPVMGVNGIVAATACMYIVSFALLRWFFATSNKHRNIV